MVRAENWVGLESNPGVMSSYAERLGMDPAWAFSDCWGLDADALKYVPQPTVAAILLYPFSLVEQRKRALGRSAGSVTPAVWHMKQTVGNSCGAVAIMHAVMNNLDRLAKSDSLLERFRDGGERSARDRGEGFASAVRELHSDIAVEGQTDAPTPTADLDFHFVALVERDGRLYELDGNNVGPVDVGAVDSCDGFLDAVAEHIEAAYITPFPNAHFSLITLGPKRADDE